MDVMVNTNYLNMDLPKMPKDTSANTCHELHIGRLLFNTLTKCMCFNREFKLLVEQNLAAVTPQGLLNCCLKDKVTMYSL